MNDLEDFVLDSSYQPNKIEQDEISKLKAKTLRPKDWGSRKKGITSFKKNIVGFLFERQNYRCAYCRMEIVEGLYFPQEEHIIPKSAHPQWMFEPKNLCIACQQCNTNKGAKDVLVNSNTSVFPTESKDYKIINPYLDRYSEHIELLNGIISTGITTKGKFTIRTCNLNRESLILYKARKRMSQENPESVMTQVLSLLEESSEMSENCVEIKERIKRIVKRYKKINS